MQTSTHEFWGNYRSEVVFGLVLAVIVSVSTFLSQFISVFVFDKILTPAFNIATCTVALFGAWVTFRHSEGLLIRKIWILSLLFWFLGDLFYLVTSIIAPAQVMDMGAAKLTTFELLFGNMLGWVMTLYPTETLRPGWLNWKIVLWQVLPLFGMVALDYIVSWNLWPLVALYPYILLVLVLTHIRAYRIWCENNFSSLDNIDVQWIIRYCIMLFIIGVNYVYICSTDGHARAFTQQWFVIFMLVYSTEQILFRKTPWEGIHTESDNAGLTAELADSEPSQPSDTESAQPDHVRLLEEWLEKEKPYLNPNFKLMDLRVVLPMNRTYLSQFINDTYGCSFYQFVNRHRIEEAQRLMREYPEMKMTDVAIHSGFASREAFARTFTQITGTSPKEWTKVSD